MAEKFNKFKFQKSLHGKDLSDGAYRVLITMLDYADPDGGNCFPDRKELAAACVMGERTVERHIATLVGLGLVARESRGRGAKGSRSKFTFAAGAVAANPDGNAYASTRQIVQEYPPIPAEVPANPDVSSRQSVQTTREPTSANTGLPDQYQINDQITDQRAHGDVSNWLTDPNWRPEQHTNAIDDEVCPF